MGEVAMEMRRLGRTELQVSRLGIGLAEIGFELTLDQAEKAARVLNAALDGGVNFLDTAACYGISEELIGRTIAHRRDEYVLASKAGHVTGGYEGREWEAKTIGDSIDRSLVRMKTDHLDLVLLHTCDLEVLQRGEVVQALLEAKEAGKTRYIGYSGDNEAADWAVESGVFDALETSFNLVDQRACIDLFPQAEARGIGVIAKRPIANAVWGTAVSRSAYRDEYHRRAAIMAREGPIPGGPENPILMALGFTLAHDAVDTAIVGTRSPEHVEANIRMVEHELPLASQVVEELRRRFEKLEQEWRQME
jgi:aryl-alcohol dehydrogenase-like predicted oxidoreductase